MKLFKTTVGLTGNAVTQSVSQMREKGHWRQIATDSKGAIATADMEGRTRNGTVK